MLSRRPPRLAPSLYAGPVRIFYTMCTFQRRPVFGAQAIVELVALELLHNAALFEVEILAYCFMPDHLHYLAEGLTDRADLLRFTRTFRQRSGFRHRQTRPERLWQEGYFDRHLRDEEATLDVVAYIIGNPVRAGLCASPQDHAFSGGTCFEKALATLG
jgi:REP element-mobilizing transposase RayT